MSALAGAGAPAALSLLAAGSAAAQTATDYKALVCIFLYGGNDAFNRLLATDSESWQAYSTTRNQAPESIALLAPGVAANSAAAAGSPARLGGVLPLTPISSPLSSPLNSPGSSLALHPLMGTLQTMFNSERRLAMLPNIGPLVMPTTKAQYNLGAHPKPARLLSHNDQLNTWQALAPEGTVHGWGGRMGDMLAAMNSRAVFTSISAGNNAVWLSGRTVQQYQVGSNGALRLGADSNGRVFGLVFGSTEVAAALERIASSSRGSHVFAGDVAAIAQRSIDAEVILRTALRPASDAAFGTAPNSGAYNANNDPRLQVDNPLNGGRSSNALAQQLQVVARMVDAGISGATGARRQVCFVNMGGFDNHDAQNRNQADLLARLAHAMRYFDTTLGAMGARSNVTSFTASEFGRTFTSNGDGTDHGWGSHHFVMGGAVRGGQLYGRLPTLAVKNSNNNNFDGSPDQLGNGALLPTTSVDQLGAWFGLNGEQLADCFPNLANFDASVRNLGLMAA